MLLLLRLPQLAPAAADRRAAATTELPAELKTEEATGGTRAHSLLVLLLPLPKLVAAGTVQGWGPAGEGATGAPLTCVAAQDPLAGALPPLCDAALDVPD